ncbi:hypothetical protein Agabi119p4_7989 [Agaricus bisporus var. burnettii]|uniref:Uncharacterized protein n=1 Tax=Agaricus bisporus var. burnettii TaxID=192524 RepID=A0A8H7EXX4_AGABI|nr:hypothetical protein Agabi119p4_7989 [Agaricus bisporus var. burnettii]
MIELFSSLAFSAVHQKARDKPQSIATRFRMKVMKGNLKSLEHCQAPSLGIQFNLKNFSQAKRYVAHLMQFALLLVYVVRIQTRMTTSLS